MFQKTRKTIEANLRKANEQTRGETKTSLPLITAGPKLDQSKRVRPPPLDLPRRGL